MYVCNKISFSILVNLYQNDVDFLADIVICICKYISVERKILSGKLLLFLKDFFKTLRQ